MEKIVVPLTEEDLAMAETNKLEIELEQVNSRWQSTGDDDTSDVTHFVEHDMLDVPKDGQQRGSTSIMGPGATVDTAIPSLGT